MMETVTQVRPGLYLGGADIAGNKAALEALEITHILNCARPDCDNYWTGRFVYLDLWLKDKASEPIDALFYSCYHFLTAALCSGGHVLIHCLRGVSRSVTILLSFLILQERCPYPSALVALQALRPCVCPNLGYQRRLQAWSDRLLSPIVPFVRVYQAGYIGSRAYMRLVEAEKGSFSLDERVAIVIHSEKWAFLWVGGASSEPFLSAAEALISNLQRFEGLKSAPIYTGKDRESELFWQDFRPFHADFPSPYLPNPQNDRFLVPFTSPSSSSAACFYIYPDIVPYSHIAQRDIAADRLILHFNPNSQELNVYIGPAFEPDILSASDYVSMVQSRSGRPRVVSVTEKELRVVVNLGIMSLCSLNR